VGRVSRSIVSVCHCKQDVLRMGKCGREVELGEKEENWDKRASRGVSWI
jgi:hypothetical protein